MPNKKIFFETLPLENNLTKDLVAIVVTHLVADADNFLKIISSLFSDLIIIPKKSSKTSEALKRYSKYGYVLEATREEILENPAEVIFNLDTVIKGRKFLIFDMGGYFSSLISLLNLRESQLIGIVEDTENGHIKYLSELRLSKGCNFPIISVARSSLKEPEDILVGQAIAFSIEKILRSNQLILVNKIILVIGYGKIGAGICQAMKGRGATVYFYDVDPIRTVKGLASGFKTGQKDILIAGADLIISATGNKGLSRRDLNVIRDGVYIFTATSSDDEFEDCLVTFFENQYSGTGSILVDDTNIPKSVKFCNQGNPINFLDGAVVDRYIELVQAEMLLASNLLHASSAGRLIEINDEQKRFIAKSWLNFYSKNN